MLMLNAWCPMFDIYCLVIYLYGQQPSTLIPYPACDILLKLGITENSVVQG